MPEACFQHDDRAAALRALIPREFPVKTSVVSRLRGWKIGGGMEERSIPYMTTDEEAEAFLDQDLSDLDFTEFQPLE